MEDASDVSFQGWLYTWPFKWRRPKCMADLNDLLQKIVHCLGWEYNGTCTLPEANSSHLKTFLGVCSKKVYWDIKKKALLDFQKSFVALDPGVTDVDNEQSTPVFHAALQDDSACCHHQLRREPATFRPAARASTTWRPQVSSDQMWSVGSLVCAGLYIKLIETSRRDKNPYCERSRISCSLTGLWTLLKWKEGLRAPIVLGWNFGWWNPTRRIMKSPMKCNSSYSPTRKSERGQWYFFWFKLGCCCPIR